MQVLDKGFVRVVDRMGDDAAIVQAARVSYGAGTKHVSTDRALIRYLMRHRHTSPFEMCEIKLHVRAPIFVARQWLRHRTASVNEISGRYSVLDADCFEPEQLEAQSSGNRQGRDRVPCEGAGLVRQAQQWAVEAYRALLAAGCARELARIVLPLSVYTEWYWKIDLHNLLHFLELRLAPEAQAEIRAYAEAIATYVREWVPVTWEAFEDYRLYGARLSRQETELVRCALRGEPVDPDKVTRREWVELTTLLPELCRAKAEGNEDEGSSFYQA